MVKSHGSSAPLSEALSRKLARRTASTGQITVPAVPSMIDDYVATCGNVFADIGREFSPEELNQLRELLQRQLDEAFAKSPRSSIVVSYSASAASLLNYEINIEWWSLDKAYENWISTRKPPLFGTEPDARVWAAAGQAGAPAASPVLDIGAGTGRNALALARRGHPVDAVELTPKFAEQIAEQARTEALNVRVIHGDVFATTGELRPDYQLILLSEVVSDFRSLQQLRGVFELAAGCLAAGGQLLFNVFLAKAGYTPDAAARELGQQVYTSIFTEDELAMAAAGLPLIPAGDDSVHEYEEANLPDGAWPPTSWYSDWVSGRDLFDLNRDACPVEMRWRVYRRM
ncbi:MAG: class I SAM-dependent methyltransferase [Mycobacterium sp.]